MSRAPRTAQRGEETRALILEAILDLPLGATLRDVAQRIGRSVSTVRHHVPKLRKTGHVQVVQRGHWKRRIIVPFRMRMSEVEKDWLKLGTTTARAIVVVARAEGRTVPTSEVAKTLGWREGVAEYHLKRAAREGLLEMHLRKGYTLPCAHPVDRERAGLDQRALQAVRYIAEQGRRLSSAEVARAHGWNQSCAQCHLKRAVKVGLLASRIGPGGGYEATQGARLVNWEKSAASA